jgi:inorganic pyrophosphatase
LLTLQIPDGKPENVFAFSGEAKPKKYAQEIVLECHEAWKKLIKGESPPGEIALQNTTVNESSSKVATTDAAYAAIPAANPLAPAPIDPSIDKSFFISSASQ